MRWIEPFFPLKLEILFDLERARFLAHFISAFMRLSIRSSVSTSRPSALADSTSAQ